MAPTPTDSAGFVAANPTAVLTSRASAAVARTPLSSAAAPLTHPAVRVPTASAPTLCPQVHPARASSLFSGPPPAAGPCGTAIVLFRSDLRVDDHPALARAVEDASTIVPVFCFDPRHFGRTKQGFDKTGKYRARFLIESVHALRTRLQGLGADLVVRVGRPEDVVPDLATRVGATRVLLHREVTFEEQQVEDALRKSLSGRGVDMQALWANTLYHVDDLPFSLDAMPDVYSDFREAVEVRARVRDPLDAPEELAALPAHVEVGDVPTLSQLGLSECSVGAAEGVAAVKGGEDEAMRRVQAYVADSRRLETSQNGTRDTVTPHLGADFSCRISPWLALGCVSPRRIFKEMRGGGLATPNMLMRSSTYFELIWRDFFRCITAKYSERRSKATAKTKTRTMERALAGVY